MDAVERARVGEEDAVRVDEEVADALLAQELVDAGHVAALAEPHALRAPAEEALVDVCAAVWICARKAAQLRSSSGKNGCVAVQVMISSLPGVLEGAEAAHEIAVVAAPAVADLVEAVAVHLRQLVVGAVLAPGAVDSFSASSMSLSSLCA